MGDRFGKCLPSCPKGFFIKEESNPDGTVRKLCTACHPSCVNCLEHDENEWANKTTVTKSGQTGEHNKTLLIISIAAIGRSL